VGIEEDLFNKEIIRAWPENKPQDKGEHKGKNSEQDFFHTRKKKKIIIESWWGLIGIDYIDEHLKINY